MHTAASEPFPEVIKSKTMPVAISVEENLHVGDGNNKLPPIEKSNRQQKCEHDKMSSCRDEKEAARRPETASQGRLHLDNKEERISNPQRNSSSSGDDAGPQCATQLHTQVCEQGGITMAELTEAMMADADNQERLCADIGEMLEATVSRNDSKGRKGGLAAFEGDKSPVSASAFVKRIVKYAECSPCCLVIGVLYLERLKRRHKTLCLTSNNFQRLFLVAVMTAAKMFDDFYYSNQHWAEVGGISVTEMNNIELEFLFRMNFFLTMERENYDSFVEQLLED